ncbi:MAG: hypothetical protein ACREM3_19030, partial [Candidatus Rokuibacteriota bacterium]
PPRPTTYTARYTISLSQVERPAKAKERYGEQKITQIQEEGALKYYFEDEMVRILWFPTSTNVAFVLNNKTDHSIRIVWNDAAFVDASGISHRVMHEGVKYADRNNPQPPSVIVRRGSVKDFILPTTNVHWVEGYYSRYTSIPGRWSHMPLLPNSQVGGDPEKLRSTAQGLVGKTYQVLLPLQIEDVVNDYIFTFKVDRVEFAEKRE